ncbi:MAG: type I DNA topoisomerase [Actinomycetota bacterium]|nr:type I DNA topoisomerase [Actinomycetota bacterium]MEE3015932.1 type I DNA topoisomerase [Actinomycetota bacterium]
MAKSLVIVESPAKAKTISRFLGDDYTVEASVGHIRDLIQPKDVKIDNRFSASIHIENPTLLKFGIESNSGSLSDPQLKKLQQQLGTKSWVPWYVESIKSQKTITQLKRALKKADALYLATDEDREGEAIAWHLVEVLQPDLPVYRMVFHEITEKAILEALQNTRAIDMNQVSAQETRRVLDRIIGYDLSGLARQVIGGGATGGRVQSPTLRKIVERERERIRFRSTAYWSATAEINSNNSLSFDAKLIGINHKRVASGKNDFNENGELKRPDEVVVLSEENATRVQKQFTNEPLTTTSIETSPYRRQPKPPFTTSTFQQEVINKLGGSSGAAMAIAQGLYQNGYITYHRTDSPGLSDQALNAARKEVEELCGADYLPDKPRTYVTKSDSAQEAHEAIRPAGETFRAPEELRNELNKDQLAVYELIWKRTLASQMTDETGETKRVTFEGETPELDLYHATFSSTGRTITHSGFKKIYQDVSEELADHEDATILPDLEEGEKVTAKNIEVHSHETKPPARYTEASLVKWMEEAGIGRPSTFAATIGKIQAREYTHKSGRALVPTVKAFVATNFSENEFKDEVQYEYTANLNQKLDLIADGTLDRDDFLNDWYFQTSGWESRIDNIQNQIKVDLPRIRHEAAHSIGHDQETEQYIFARFANQKPYVQISVDGETASLPPTLPLDELTVKKAKDLINLASQPDTVLGWVNSEKAIEIMATTQIERILGYDPSKGLPVYLRNGSFGEYVSLGDFPKWPPMSSKEGRLMKQPHHLKVIKVACAYLQAAANPDDDDAMKIILNEPKRGIGKKSIENIESIAANEAISFKEAIAKQKLLKDKPAKAVRKLIKKLNSWETNNVDEPVGFRLRELLIDAGYWKEISRMDKAEDKIKVLENLLATLNEFSTVENILRTLSERQELKDAPKPKTASLLERMSVETITIEDAINVLSLPRELPIQETITVEIDPPPKKGEAKFKLLKDEMITVHNGPFGPYIRIDGDDCGVQTRSISEDDIFSIDLDGCLSLLATPKKFQRRQTKTIILKDNDGKPATDSVSGKPIEVKTGKFGPYVTDGTTNASLQLGDSIEQITSERAKELLADRRAQQN